MVRCHADGILGVCRALGMVSSFVYRGPFVSAGRGTSTRTERHAQRMDAAGSCIGLASRGISRANLWNLFAAQRNHPVYPPPLFPVSFLSIPPLWVSPLP